MKHQINAKANCEKKTTVANECLGPRLASRQFSSPMNPVESTLPVAAVTTDVVPQAADACDWIHEMQDGRIVTSHPRVGRGA